MEETVSPRERRRREKDRQILNAATALILGSGLANVSMDNIVAAAGVSKRTLYNYYASKEDLFVALVLDQLESLWPALGDEKVGKGTAEHRLREVAETFMTILNQPSAIAVYRIIVSEAQRFPDLAKQIYELSSMRMINGVALILKDLSREAKMPIDDPTRAAERFLDLFLGTAYMRVVLGIEPPMSTKKIGDFVDGQVEHFLRACRV